MGADAGRRRGDTFVVVVVDAMDRCWSGTHTLSRCWKRVCVYTLLLGSIYINAGCGFCLLACWYVLGDEVLYSCCQPTTLHGSKYTVIRVLCVGSWEARFLVRGCVGPFCTARYSNSLGSRECHTYISIDLFMTSDDVTVVLQ